MCTNIKPYTNRYSGKVIYAKCGKCPSCLQEKANMRKRRIDYTGKSGNIWYFVTLTYDNKYLPYVRFTDLYNNVRNLPIYRDKRVYVGRYGSHYDTKEYIRDNQVPIDTLHLSEDFYRRNSFRGIKSARHKRGCVGIAYYKDLQDFLKRLRVNLARKYDYVDAFSYYACSEYGEKRQRPHFHLLINAPASAEGKFKAAVNESWRFDDSLPRKFEVARNASGYVSSYVCKSDDLPQILFSHEFKQKHSYSQGFGVDLPAFDLLSIVNASLSDYLEYNVEFVIKGVRTKCSLPIPKYVINKYFPKFTGYCRLNNVEVCDLLLSIQSPFKRGFFMYSLQKYLNVNDFECEKWRTRFENCFNKYHEITGRSLYDYANDYIKTWSRYDRTIYKRFYENKDNITWSQMYDNVINLLRCSHNESLEKWMIDEYERGIPLEFDPNFFDDRIRSTFVYEDLFYKKQKKRKTNNLIYQEMGYNY